MVTRRQFLAVLGGGAAAVIAGAAGYELLPGESKPDGLPAVKFGSEKCRSCGMIIGDERFAAAWREPSGAEAHFDDIGCLVLERAGSGLSGGTQFWVADYSTGTWLVAESARFVVAQGIKTPMSYGVIAFPDTTAAEKSADEFSGTVRRWEELPTVVHDRRAMEH